jgi:hypothetical protein
MRVAQVQAQAGHRLMAMNLDHGIKALFAGSVGIHDAPVAEVDGNEIALEVDDLDAAPGGDGELVSRLQTFAAKV